MQQGRKMNPRGRPFPKGTSGNSKGIAITRADMPEDNHDWASHSADAFRYMAMAYKETVPDPPPKTVQWKFLHEATLDELWEAQDPRRDEVECPFRMSCGHRVLLSLVKQSSAAFCEFSRGRKWTTESTIFRSYGCSSSCSEPILLPR